ncbi:MAG TPA: hypothetical protein VF574_01660 [Allosphingosinicella sp.]|jgi:hypothetical protein
MFKRLRGWDEAMEGSSLIRSGAAALLLLAAAAPAAAPPARPIQYGQVVREQVIIRFRQTPPTRVEWKEGKGPKCIPARAIAGATLVGRSSVDLIMRNRQRVRARLESSCPALDYYYGFYITPNPDGMVCEDRDNIRSRMGGACEIDRFRSLEPVLHR